MVRLIRRFLIEVIEDRVKIIGTHLLSFMKQKFHIGQPDIFKAKTSTSQIRQRRNKRFTVGKENYLSCNYRRLLFFNMYQQIQI